MDHLPHDPKNFREFVEAVLHRKAGAPFSFDHIPLLRQLQRQRIKGQG
jgi:hypothetical protein